MTHNSKFAILLAAGAMLAAAAVPARAQVNTAPMIKAKPLHTQKSKPSKARFAVLRMTSAAIQVRSLVNEREIHTFAYANAIRDKMQQLLDRGGYQYGDVVEIEYEPGAEIALKIKGKPSKPL
jgi:hypothetical protein